MSWSIKVSGANKTECLMRLSTEVNTGPQADYIEPKATVLESARLMAQHMEEDSVKSISSGGHTNADGQGCNMSISVACY